MTVPNANDQVNSDSGSNRADAGRAMMKQVYGFDIGEFGDGFVKLTVEHLFGDIWAEGKLSIRERRLMLLGMLVGTGAIDVAELQVNCALDLSEITPDELREMVVFLAHYAGWPQAAKFNQVVETAIAKRSTQS